MVSCNNDFVSCIYVSMNRIHSIKFSSTMNLLLTFSIILHFPTVVVKTVPLTVHDSVDLEHWCEN